MLLSDLFEYTTSPNGVANFRMNLAGEFFRVKALALILCINQLPAELATDAIKNLEGRVAMMMKANDFCAYSSKAIDTLKVLLESAGGHGFDAVGLLSAQLGADDYGRLLVDRAFDWVEGSEVSQTLRTLWMEALVLCMDEETLLSEVKEEHVLAWLAQVRRSEGIKAALQKTNTGRDILMAQDLGL